MINTIILLEQDLVKFTDHQRLTVKDALSLLNPRFWPILIFRLSNCLYRHNCGILAKLLSFKNQVFFGCDIARGAKIAGGLYLPHPNGIVIGEHVTIGRNCIIHQGVTLGARGEDHELANPIVGNEVEIGTGAKVLGYVKIGNYARIGANAVVVHDVPDYGIAVGIPAKTTGFRPHDNS